MKKRMEGSPTKAGYVLMALKICVMYSYTHTHKLKEIFTDHI